MAPTVYVDDAESSHQGNSNLTRSSSISPIHLSARAVVQHARETLANGLDVPLLNYASQIDSVQVYPHHISNINQPPTGHQNAISGRSSTRRSRGEAFNSYSNAREELHAVNHYLQREVIPSISEGKF